jgi:hypothetical protein
MFSSAALLCGTDRLMRKLCDGEKKSQNQTKRKRKDRKKEKRFKNTVSIKLGNTGIDFRSFYFVVTFFAFPSFCSSFLPQLLFCLYRQHPAPFSRITILHGSIQSHPHFDFPGISDI